jgi:hypothetical protein
MASYEGKFGNQHSEYFFPITYSLMVEIIGCPLCQSQKVDVQKISNPQKIMENTSGNLKRGHPKTGKIRFSDFFSSGFRTGQIVLTALCR